MDPYGFVGPRPVWIGRHTFGIDAVSEAALAISAGLCTTVVIANGQAGMYRDRSKTAPWTRPIYEFTSCWGLYTAAEFALLARRHMHLFGTTPEQLATVAATIRTHGAMNPNAVMFGKASRPEDVLASRMIADPLHLLDCSLTTEGGGAVVLTRADRAKDLYSTPVYILGAGTEHRGTGYQRPPTWEDWGWLGEAAAKRAFEMARCTPSEVDFCELYDPFSFEIIHQLEAFGFCDKGEGGPFVMDGRISLTGELPVSTDGGLLAFSHSGEVQMLQRVIEAVEQLRGRGGARQVPGARLGLVSNNAMAIRSVLLLSREAGS
jgi:acetyl-CoA acetyltransferase